MQIQSSSFMLMKVPAIWKMIHDELRTKSVQDQLKCRSLRGSTWSSEMESDSDYYVEGSGLELVHVSEVLDYLGVLRNRFLCFIS